MAIQDELLELERAGWDSLCQSTGDEFYGNAMTDDALMVLANGKVMDRRMVVRSLADAPAWADYEIDDPHLITLGDEAYALVYTGTGRRDGDDDFVGIMTSVYVRHDGVWKLAFYQQTSRGADLGSAPRAVTRRSAMERWIVSTEHWSPTAGYVASRRSPVESIEAVVLRGAAIGADRT